VDAARAVRRVLKHEPIPAGQRALLKALYEAGDEGLSTSELAALLNRNEQQLNRLLARLARRIRRTPDVTVLQRPGITLLFDITPDEGQWRYKLRRVARKALAGQHPYWAERQGESAVDAG
jgi:GH24 family phage-related lysozyme (muramidase)